MRSPPPFGSAVMKTVYQLPVQRSVATAFSTCAFLSAIALVVGHRDRALLRHERLRRAAADLVGGLGIGAADGGERIRALTDARIAAEARGVGADVARRAVADAIVAVNVRVRIAGRSAVDVVAEAQARRAVGFDLDDEMRVGRRRRRAGRARPSSSSCRRSSTLVERDHRRRLVGVVVHQVVRREREVRLVSKLFTVDQLRAWRRLSPRCCASVEVRELLDDDRRRHADAAGERAHRPPAG